MEKNEPSKCFPIRQLFSEAQMPGIRFGTDEMRDSMESPITWEIRLDWTSH